VRGEKIVTVDISETIKTATRQHSEGRYAEAVESYRELLQTDPANAELYVNIGIALKAQGKSDVAIANYKQAIQLKPELAEAYYNLANAFRDQQRYAEAIENYRQAVTLKPDLAQAYYNMGDALRSNKQPEEAIEAFRKAVTIKPGYAIAHNNLAMILNDIGRSAEAIENYRKAIQSRPDYAQAHNNLGIALKNQGRLDEAIASYAEAVRLKSDYPEAYYNMGIALHARGDHDRALECWQRAIELAPDYAQAHWNRSLVLLLEGRYDEGWREYEWRRRTNLLAFAYPHKLDKPRWDGKPFAGKKLLVHYEQGLGDNLQFVRYLPMVKQLGGTVIFETLKPLGSLLRNFDGIDELIEASPDSPPDVEFDVYTSLMDLPGIFGTTVDNIPAEVPYLHADPARVECWRGRLSGAGLKVGLVWSGRPMGTNEVLSLQHRSCRLEHFLALADIPDVSLYGLQKGPAAEQAAQLSKQIVARNYGEQFEDFGDTAAAIENLDLVISIDTSVAHLAGAMGKPVWVLLKSDADWRWLLDRDDCPWYPTMRLFRQNKPYDWTEVLGRVADELRKGVDT